LFDDISSIHTGALALPHMEGELTLDGVQESEELDEFN